MSAQKPHSRPFDVEVGRRVAESMGEDWDRKWMHDACDEIERLVEQLEARERLLAEAVRLLRWYRNGPSPAPWEQVDVLIASYSASSYGEIVEPPMGASDVCHNAAPSPAGEPQ